MKQQLAAMRMLFDWLITGQVAPSNPASAVRGLRYAAKTRKTPVFDALEWCKLIDSIPIETAGICAIGRSSAASLFRRADYAGAYE